MRRMVFILFCLNSIVIVDPNEFNYLMISMITITNTLSGKKELFKPLVPGEVSLYVCGITPYDYAHIGHGRVYVTFDVLYRLLKFLGYKVTYTRNFTDIDDKIIARAQKEFGDPNLFKEISKKYIDAFHEDVKALNCLPPTYEPTVTQTMPEIIKFVQGLVNASKAYVSNSDVYFEISKFPQYGVLSKHKLEDLIAGARVEISEKKKNPLDFALWKGSPENEPGWDCPWGHGRPGWHIECSAMAEKFLGDTIDIHAGGLDLIFPHHENEIAQSEALHGKEFVRYWMHNGFVRINEEKMSKSLGNFFTLRDVFKQFDPMVVRFYLLNHQYKAPLDFSFDDLQMMQKTYQRLCKQFEVTCPEFTDQHIKESATVQKMLEFLSDDLNTPGMWGILFESLPVLHKDNKELCSVKSFIQKVLGLTLIPLPEKEIEITPEIEQLIKERDEARAAKNWKKADELRDQLRNLGYEVKDKKQ
jgi:cysteinyl-tRNA synthetase